MTTAVRRHLRAPRAAARRLRAARHPLLVALGLAIPGLLLAAIGGGIGLRFVTKTGFTTRAVLGLLAMVVGLVLLAYAAGIAWRATRRWQRLWFLPVGLVSLMLMFSIAQGAMLAVSPRTSLGSVTPADRGLAYTSVSFRTSDGARLSAWYVPSRNSAAVVTLPGSGSNRTATLDQAVVLARHGYGVLLVDPRGQGNSGGSAMDAGWYGDRDVTAAVGFLQQHEGIRADRIGLMGLSMGGEEAIGAAAANPSIRAVVAEGATHRTAADKAGYLPGGVPGFVQRGLDRLTYGIADVLSPAPQPRTLHDAIGRATGTSFLLIAAGNGIDEPEAVAHLRTAAPDRVRTWTVPGATHVHGLATAPAEWTATVTAFLDAALTR